MKTTFIDQLTAESGTVTDFFQVTEAARKEKKDGAPYLALKLTDKTGTLPGNLWAIPEGLELKSGDYIKAEVSANVYRDALQLKLGRVRLALPEEIRREDFMPASKRDRPQMLEELRTVVNTIHDRPLRCAIFEMLAEVNDQLQDAPAAKGNHQAYLGGLLEHILSLCGLVNKVCDHYADLNRDVMLAGAIVHDIGKIHELTYETKIGYSRAGSLTGHIVMGAIVWAKYSGALDRVTREHVEHVIVSHHGVRAWGSPIEPMTREAAIFHALDLIDSRYEMIGNAIAAGTDEEGLTAWNNKAGTAFWSGK